MERTIMIGSKWREEMKLQIYRDCLNALDNHRKTGRDLRDCLAEFNLEVIPMEGSYIKKEKKKAPYVAYISKCHIRFHIGEMKMPKWEGWGEIANLAERIGLEMKQNGIPVPPERTSLGYGMDVSAFNSALGIPNLEELRRIKGRTVRHEYCALSERMLRTEINERQSEQDKSEQDKRQSEQDRLSWIPQFGQISYQLGV